MDYAEYLTRSFSVLKEHRLAYDLESFIKTGITTTWYLAGWSGGNCYGDEAQYDEGEEEPEAEGLRLVLEAVSVGLNPAQENHIKEVLTKYSEDCDPGYYGNETNAASRTLDIEKLYEYLREDQALKD